MTISDSDVTSATALASWTACDNVTSYTLQLASDDQFTTGSSGGFTENFSGFSSTPQYNSTEASQTVDSGTWSYVNVMFQPTAGSNPPGSGGLAQIQKSNGYLYLPVVDNPTSLSMNVKGSGTGTMTLQQKIDGEWTTIGSFSVSTTCAEYNHTFTDAGAATTLRLHSSDRALYVYDISVEASGNGSLIDEYSVSGTSYSFASLTPETTYYARVKGNADWSNVAEFTTEAANAAAPTIAHSSSTPISCDAGETVTVTVTGTGHGAAPTLSVSGGGSLGTPTVAIDGDEYTSSTTWTWTPDAPGEHTITFTADANDASLSATATLTVTVGLAAPVLLPATDVTFNSLTVNWQAVPGADGYLLDVAKGSDPFSDLISMDGIWELVTNINDLAVGDKVVIAALGSDFAMSAIQGGNNRGAVAISKNGTRLVVPNAETVAILTLGEGKTSGTWSFYDANTNGYLYAASSSSNHLKTETTLDNEGNSSWTIEVAADGEATVVAQGSHTHNTLRYNSNNALFSCYASGQSAVCLYRHVVPRVVTGTSFAVAGLDASTTYRYRLIAVDTTTGTASPATVGTETTTAPSPPATTLIVF